MNSEAIGTTSDASLTEEVLITAPMITVIALGLIAINAGFIAIHLARGDHQGIPTAGAAYNSGAITGFGGSSSTIRRIGRTRSRHRVRAKGGVFGKCDFSIE
ncbi:MAG: hypothetical protein U5R31_14855 [Acidimicrobiia bacterium]|nr:hypothetical protein [Acidimicrobiia bacterium]